MIDKAHPMLQGIKVVDLTTVVFGPYCTQILSDFGADVTKVESKGGDIFRQSGKPAATRGMSPGHIALNRGKRSVILDLKKADGKTAMEALLREADIFVHNVRADAIERLGFDYESVKALNPDIIYVHCTGFGSQGPYGGLQAYDDVIQAASGAASLASRVDGNPAQRYIPSLIADKVAGLNAAYAAMAAIIHRLRTGEGQFVEVPMFEAFTNFMLKEHLYGRTFDPPVGRVCYYRQVDPDRQPFPTSDGAVSIVPYKHEHWEKILEILGDTKFIKKPEFDDPISRIKNRAPIYQRIAELTPSMTSDDCVKAMHAADIPAIKACDIGEVIDDPHLNAVGFFMRREHPTEGNVVEMREAAKFSAWSPSDPKAAPRLGEHTDEVLEELGLSD